MKKLKHSLIYRNSLSFAFLLLFLLSFIGQFYTGLSEFNEYLKDHGLSRIGPWSFFMNGYFLQSTFENWESEFLQMALFVVLTIFLRQEGSSESKKLSGKEKVDRKPRSHPVAPLPVIKGGILGKIYNHSLTIALFILYLFSFMMHWYGSWLDTNFRNSVEHKPTEEFISYLFSSRLWFESFQNWQSEFLSVFALIFLSIYLRQIGSPQSKPVDAPHKETGER